MMINKTCCCLIVFKHEEQPTVTVIINENKGM